MPTYPTYKLGEICVIERGGSPRPIKDYLTKDDNGLNWIKIGDATLSNKYIYTTAEKIKPEGLSKTRMVESGDLILSNSMSFGRPYIMRTSGCIHDGWVVFRLNKDIIDEEYLYNILNSNEVYAQFNHLATGSTVKNLNIDRVKEVVIPLPPLATQRAIVTRIEALFAELDKAVQHLRTAQQQLKTYRQAVLNHWLNNEDGKWEVVKLGEVIEKPTYGTSKKCDYDIVGTGVLRIPNIGNGYIIDEDLKFAVFSDEEKEKYSLKEGDLLTIRSNGSVDLVGKCALISSKEEKYLFAGYLIRLRPFPEKVNSKYLTLTLESHKLRIQIEDKAKSTSGVNNINSVEIQNLIIPLPPLAEQQRIVQEIESRLSQATASETYIENALQQAEALRQSILKKAFSGELV